MNSLFEVIDLSKEYQLETYSVLILLSDLEQEKLFTLFPELKRRFDKVMSYKDWGEYLKINEHTSRNDAKFRMRTINKSAKIRVETEKYYEMNEISQLFENTSLKTEIDYALSFLTKMQQQRFLLHFKEHLTYRDIAALESRSVSTIFESINCAKCKFLKNFNHIPEQNTPNNFL